MGTRQWAVVAWLGIFVVWALSQKEVRSSIPDLLRTLFSTLILVPISLILLWNAVVVVVLYRVGFWNPSMFYDTLLFIAVGGIGSYSKAAQRGATYDRTFFARTILANLELIVLFTFLSDFFAFDFWIEFLLVVPLMTLLVLLVIVSERQKGAEQVHRFLSDTQSFIGLLLIGYVIIKVIAEYRQLLHLQVLYALLLPFLMSVLFAPLLFFLCVVIAYQEAFVQFRVWGDEEVQRLSPYKRWRLLLRFKLNAKAVQMFRRSPRFQELVWATTEEDVRRITGH